MTKHLFLFCLVMIIYVCHIKNTFDRSPLQGTVGEGWFYGGELGKIYLSISTVKELSTLIVKYYRDGFSYHCTKIVLFRSQRDSCGYRNTIDGFVKNEEKESHRILSPDYKTVLIHILRKE